MGLTVGQANSGDLTLGTSNGTIPVSGVPVYTGNDLQGTQNAVQNGVDSGYQLSGYTIGGAPKQTAPVDPYAKYGGTAAYNNLVSGFDRQKSDIINLEGNSASNMQGDLGIKTNDTIHNLLTGQQALDRTGVQNESSRIQGGRDIMDMVGQGIKSGGVILGNKNAGSSSASQAIADAYSRLGGIQMNKVGQQYGAAAADLGVKQKEQDYQLANAPGKFHQGIIDNVNSIVQDAQMRLNYLDTQMANSSLPDRLNIQHEIDGIRADALGKLQGFDSQLQTGIAPIHAADRETNIGGANTLLSTGTQDPNLFHYDTSAPAQFQNTGPFASSLPLFTGNGKKQTGV